jgi:hypothetical protein
MDTMMLQATVKPAWLAAPPVPDQMAVVGSYRMS